MKFKEYQNSLFTNTWFKFGFILEYVKQLHLIEIRNKMNLGMFSPFSLSFFSNICILDRNIFEYNLQDIQTLKAIFYRKKLLIFTC